MNIFRRTVSAVVLLLLLFPGKVMADHVVGEDMAIIPINKADANFLLVLNVYVDEIRRPVTGREQEQTVQIYRKRDGKFMMQARVRAYTTPFYRLEFTNEKCADLFNLKQYRMRYEREVMLDPNLYDDPQGYFMVHDRCCRTEKITTIKNAAKTALTIRLEFPPLKQNPSYASTEFGFPNGEFLCVNKPFKMSLAVRNPENKELKFSLVEPLAGFSEDGKPDINYPPATYVHPSPVRWETGFGLAHFMPATKNLSVDPKTGEISVSPSATGTYVFGVMVEEFSDGIKTGSSIRDYSFFVFNCQSTPPPIPLVTYLGNSVKEIQICAGATINLETFNNPDLNYTWQNNGRNILGEQLNKIALKDTGTFVVVASPRNRCADESFSEPVKIKLLTGSTPIKILTNSTEACIGEHIKLKTNEPGTKPDWYLDNVFLENIETLAANKPGEYTARKGGGLSGCPTVEDKITLKFSPKPEVSAPLPGYEFCPGETLTLETINDNGYRYQWYKDNAVLTGVDANRFRIEVKEKGVYHVQVDRIGFNCTSESDKHKVMLRPDCDPLNPQNSLFFPTAFSPNSDGLNDTWTVVNFDKCTDCRIFIYDGWGKLIYDSTSPWDGRHNDKPVPAGRYNYVVSSATRRYEGAVMVLR